MNIQYNIVSHGTESQGNSDGYMAVSEDINGSRFILPIPHKKTNCDDMKGSLQIKKDLSIEKITVARFGLISQLFVDNYKLAKNKKILVVGIGCVGFACVQILKLNNYKYVYYTDKSNANITEAEMIDNNKVNYHDFDVIIEATGKIDVLNKIIRECKIMSTIILLGTCREAGGIEPLLVHRKNLKILGAHELSGYTDKHRQKEFDKVVKLISKSKNDFKKVVSFVDKNQRDKLKRTSIYTVLV